MGQLLKHEFFKLVKSKGFKVTFIIAVAIAVSEALLFTSLANTLENVAGDNILELTGKTSLKLYASTVFYVLLLITIAITAIIVGDHQKGIVRNMLLSGHPRAKIFTARWIVVMFITFVFIAATYVISIIPPTIRFGWQSSAISDTEYLQKLLHMFFQAFAFGTFVLFVASSIKSIGGTIGTMLGLMIVLQTIGQFAYMFSLDSSEPNMVLFWINKLFVGNLVGEVATGGGFLSIGLVESEYYLIYFIIGVVTLILSYLIGLLQFKRADFK